MRREPVRTPLLCPMTSFEPLNQTTPETQSTPTLFNKVPFSLIHLKGSFQLLVSLPPTLNLPLDTILLIPIELLELNGLNCIFLELPKAF